MKTFHVPFDPGRAFAPLLAAVSLAIAAAGCSPPAAGPPAEVPPSVTVAPVEERTLVQWDEFTGRTEAVQRVEVRPRVSGHIDEVSFQAGQLVSEGDVLFVIDSRWYQAEYDLREAEWKEAQVRRDNARREAARTATLLERRAISQEEADQRQSRYLEADAGLLAADAARRRAELDLTFTKVRAPIDGRVSRELITAGNYVSGQAGGAAVLTTIVSVDPIHVYADVDENSLLKFNALLRNGGIARTERGTIPVELQLAGEKGFPHRGHVESFDNQLNPRSGSIVLRAEFPNVTGVILPGLFARIRLPASADAPVLLVDEAAIGTDQAQKYVLSISSSNTTVYRPVTLGSLVENKRIVLEGLEAGESIVVKGLARVRPGVAVTVEEALRGEESSSQTAKR